jgi:hypothetical protein
MNLAFMLFGDRHRFLAVGRGNNMVSHGLQDAAHDRAH